MVILIVVAKQGKAAWTAMVGMIPILRDMREMIHGILTIILTFPSKRTGKFKSGFSGLLVTKKLWA